MERPSLTNNAVSAMAKNEVHDIISLHFSDICGCAVKDTGAKSVAWLLEVEEETCNMHDSDKIGRSVIGELLRMDGNKKPVNPFLPGKCISMVVHLFILFYVLYFYVYDFTNLFCYIPFQVKHLCTSFEVRLGISIKATRIGSTMTSF